MWEQPKPPRSAFICFTDAKKEELLKCHGGVPQKKKQILKLVATEWKKLTRQQRAYWDEVAREDKVRYVSVLVSGLIMFAPSRSHCHSIRI